MFLLFIRCVDTTMQHHNAPKQNPLASQFSKRVVEPTRCPNVWVVTDDVLTMQAPCHEISHAAFENVKWKSQKGAVRGNLLTDFPHHLQTPCQHWKRFERNQRSKNSLLLTVVCHLARTMYKMQLAKRTLFRAPTTGPFYKKTAKIKENPCLRTILCVSFRRLCLGSGLNYYIANVVAIAPILFVTKPPFVGIFLHCSITYLPI